MKSKLENKTLFQKVECDGVALGCPNKARDNSKFLCVLRLHRGVKTNEGDCLTFACTEGRAREGLDTPPPHMRPQGAHVTETFPKIWILSHSIDIRC